jgi:hypothetical protein
VDERAASAGPEPSGAQADALGHGMFRRLLAYGNEVFGIGALLEAVRDGRHAPAVATSLVARIVWVLGLLRIRGFGALEPKQGGSR